MLLRKEATMGGKLLWDSLKCKEVTKDTKNDTWRGLMFKQFPRTLYRTSYSQLQNKYTAKLR
jgi:hypothetical protein